jgi:hypothetical protein
MEKKQMMRAENTESALLSGVKNSEVYRLE